MCRDRLLLVLTTAVLLAGCAELPRVQFNPTPPQGEAAFLDGDGHVNPEDPGLPNGGY